MLRRRPRLPALTLALLALSAIAVSGCSSALGSDDAQTDALKAPRLGACRVLTAEDLTKPSSSARPVPCSRPHTAQTFWTGSLPAATGSSYDDSRHGRYVYDVCRKAFAAFLGADDSLVARSQLSWAWFRPSELGWERGARWFRCDAVGGPAEATALRDLPLTVQGLFAQDLPDAWLTCATGASVNAGTKVPCSRPHTWRAVTTVKIGGPTDPYPGDRIVEVRSRDYCRDSVRGSLGYPPDFDYGYTWYRKDRWDGGNRRSICWSRTSA